MFDLVLFERIFSNNQTKVSTEQCLTDYYKKKGFNDFKSAEYAQSNIFNFVEFANNKILESKQNNISFLFTSVTENIVEVSSNFYQIKEIHRKLLEIDWREFEFISSTILEYCFGAFDVKTSQASSDGGVDFDGKLPVYSISSQDLYGTIEVYGQSKKYTGNVGINDIKAFVAFANSKKRNFIHPAQLFMFFTTSDFAKSSLDELADNGFIGLSGLQLSTLIYKHRQILKNKSDILKKIID